MEPERPIEKLLRRYAQQRQKTASKAIHLHPATRRMLQAEVGSNYPRSVASTWNWAWWIKRGWAIATITACAAIGSTWIIMTRLGKTSPEPLAKTESVSLEVIKGKDTTTNTVVSASVPEQSNLVVAMRSEDVATAPGRGTASPATISSTRLATREVTSLPPRAVEKADASTATPVTPVSAVPATTWPHPDGTAKAAASTFVASSAAGRNVQVYANNLQTSDSVANDARLAQIMASFQIEQTGNSIRIVDNDGSIYSGVLRAEKPGSQTRHSANSSVGSRSQPASRSPMPSSTASQNFTLEVSGTNLSLNQRVVFTGNLSVDNAAAQAVGRRENRSAKPIAQPSFGSVLSNSRIQGQAQVGENGIVNVEAVATQRK